MSISTNIYLLVIDLYPGAYFLPLFQLFFFYPAQKLSSAINQKQKRNKPYGNDPNTPP